MSSAIASRVLSAILASLGALHLYWAAGGRFAADVTVPAMTGGRPLFKPGVMACLVVAFGLLFAAAGVIAQFQHRTLLLRAMAAVFLIRAIGDFRYVGFFKGVLDSPFADWDTRLYSPLCVLIAVLAVVAARGDSSGSR